MPHRHCHLEHLMVPFQETWYCSESVEGSQARQKYHQMSNYKDGYGSILPTPIVLQVPDNRVLIHLTYKEFRSIRESMNSFPLPPSYNHHPHLW